MNNKKLIVIDDEELIAESLCDFIGDAGFDTLYALDGLSGLEIIRQDTAIDLAILDRNLPDIKLTELAREIIKIRPSIQIIVHTGDLTYEVSSELLSLGVKPGSIIYKPITDFDKVLSLVKAMVNS